MSTKKDYKKGSNNNKGKTSSTEEKKDWSGASFHRDTKNGGAGLITAWKKDYDSFFQFTAYLGAKKAHEVVGTNGKRYIVSVPVKILHRNTLQERWTWGIYSIDKSHLTLKDVGFYISLSNGGFVGRIRKK